MGYNGPCTWDSVVQTGMKKEDFVQLYKQTPKYMVITMFRISGVARFFFLSRGASNQNGCPKQESRSFKKNRNYVLNFLLFDSGGLTLRRLMSYIYIWSNHS